MTGGEPLDIKSTEPPDIKKAALKREKLLKGVNRVVWRENEIKLFSDFLGDDGKIVFGDDFMSRTVRLKTVFLSRSFSAEEHMKTPWTF